MGLFNKLFRSYDFESMDEMKQIELIDGLGISDLREDTESTKERIGLLEQNLDKLESSLHWRDNIITGDVALARVKEKEEESAPEELSKAFEEIRQAIDKDDTSVRMYEYECTFDGYERKYHLNNLMRLLPNYNYRVTLHKGDDLRERYVEAFWGEVKDKSTSKIDPNKKYILPMDGTLQGWGDTKSYATIENEVWEVWQASREDQIIRCKQYVLGEDILNAPDWVKAIKPIEVEE